MPRKERIKILKKEHRCICCAKGLRKNYKLVKCKRCSDKQRIYRLEHLDYYKKYHKEYFKKYRKKIYKYKVKYDKKHKIIRKVLCLFCFTLIDNPVTTQKYCNECKDKLLKIYLTKNKKLKSYQFKDMFFRNLNEEDRLDIMQSFTDNYLKELRS